MLQQPLASLLLLGKTRDALLPSWNLPIDLKACSFASHHWLESGNLSNDCSTLQDIYLLHISSVYLALPPKPINEQQSEDSYLLFDFTAIALFFGPGSIAAAQCTNIPAPTYSANFKVYQPTVQNFTSALPGYIIWVLSHIYSAATVSDLIAVLQCWISLQCSRLCCRFIGVNPLNPCQLWVKW